MSIFGFTALAIIGTVTAQFAKFEKQATLASFATGVLSARTEEFMETARRVSREVKLVDPLKAAELVRIVQELGPATREGADAILLASSAFAALNEEVTASVAARTFERLAIAMAKGNKEILGLNEQSMLAFASAIQRVGQTSKAGAAELLNYIERFGLVGITANLTAPELIGLAAGFADISVQTRELVTSGLLRLFSDEFVNNAGQFAQIMGITTGEFVKLRDADPVLLLTLLAKSFIEAGDKAKFLSRLRELGFEVRDILLFNEFVAGMANLPDFITDARREFELLGRGEVENLQIIKQLTGLQETAAGQFAAFKSGIIDLSIAIGETLTPVLLPLINGLTNLFGVLSRNKGLLGLLVAVLGVGFGRLAIGAGRLLAGPAARFFGVSGIARSLGAGAGFGGTFVGRNIGGQFTGSLRQALAGNIARLVGGGSVAGSGGRAAAGLLAGRAAFLAGGPVGALITALSLGEPIFRGLANTFSDLSKQGGFLGFVFKTLSNHLRILAIVGNGINLVFDLIIVGFKKLVEFLQELPVLGPIIKGIGETFANFQKFTSDTLDNVDKEITKARENLKGEGEQELIASARPGRDARVHIQTTVNATGGVSRAEMEQLATTIAQRSAFSVSPTLVRSPSR